MATSVTQSQRLFEEAMQYIPGGVNSPVRAFGSVGGTPRFMARGKGSHVWDADGNEYIDYLCSWGPLILGHAHPQVVAAACRAMEHGTSFGTPTEAEVTLARMIIEAVPSIDRVRLVNSGTEAAMSALRLARGYTGRDKVLKFAGCYHGHVDSLLVAAGSGVATLAIPGSPGVPEAFAAHTVVAPYNDLDAVREIMQVHGDDMAAVMIEPVAGNMGVVPPLPGFLQGLRELTEQYGALLVFDEVITGFRVSRGGAQSYYRVIPDLTVLGKIIGGGFPVGAYGGRAEVMDRMAPAGDVYQAGTLSGNPVAVAAGIATLEQLARPGIYEQLDQHASQLATGLRQSAGQHSVACALQAVGSMMTLFFTDGQVRDYQEAMAANRDTYAAFFHGMLERGIYLAPSQFEAGFVSAAHDERDIRQTLEAADAVFASLGG